MSRQKTKGDMIGVRLPVDADAILRQRAEKAGMTPAEWLVDQLTRSLIPTIATVRSPRFTADRMVEPRMKK